MNKMKSLSVLALTLMLTGVLAACGSDQAASPTPESQSSAAENENETLATEDNDAHPTDEVDIDKENSTESPTDSAIGEAQETTDLDPTTTDDSAPADNGSTDSAEPDKAPAETNTNAGTDKTESSGSTDSSTQETAPAAPATAAAEEQSAQGSYVGLADSHTAEIEVDGESVSYQLSEEAQSQLGKIPADAEVTFTYTEEDFDAETKVLTITGIKAAQ